MSEKLLAEVEEWVSIPSVSTEPGYEYELNRAAEWAAAYVRSAGGACRMERIGSANPLVIGRLEAHVENAPTVFVYGHYDVQAPGPVSAWHSPPFAPEVRDGRLYGRGAADNKGNFWPIVHVACELARQGALPVNVDLLVDGEEEIGGGAALAWLTESYRGATTAVVYDGWMVDERTPAITLALRGLVSVRLRVRSGERSVHSGMYGGAVLNAIHALHQVLAAVLPDADGRVRPELREGVEPPAAAEVSEWETLPKGEERIAEVGARPVSVDAAAEFYSRTGAEPSLDVNSILGGEPRTIVPATAEAFLSLRTTPEQDVGRLRSVLEELLRQAAPAGVDLELESYGAPGYAIAPDHPLIRRAARALEAAAGVRPRFVRIGGSVPIVPYIAGIGIPVVVAGFKLPHDAIHAPNESFRLESIELAAAWARELFAALADERDPVGP